MQPRMSRAVKRVMVSQAALDAARWQNLGHRLVALADDFSGRVLSAYRLQGYADIRPVHGAVLRNLELEGTRLTVLAARAGVTHRAMAKLVENVVSMGLVKRRQDPADGRATLITYTPRGLHLLQDSSVAIEDIYREYSGIMGARALQTLENRLYTLLTATGIELASSGLQALHGVQPGRQATDSREYLSHNLGRYLKLLADDYHWRSARLMAQEGHAGVRIDHLAVVSHLSLAGMTLSQLSESAGISLQATGKQVTSLQRLGYVTVAVDVRDKRVRQVAFSAQGHAFISALLAAFASIENEYLTIAGQRNVRQLHNSLSRAVAALELTIPLCSQARL